MEIIETFNEYIHSSYFHPLLRLWQNSSPLQISQLIYPIFVTNQKNMQTEIKSFPGQYQFSIDEKLKIFLQSLIEKGLQSVLIFGVLTEVDENIEELKKNSTGDCALSTKSPAIRAIQYLKKNFPNLLICADVCLCGYTNHGHCGILNESTGMIDYQKSSFRIGEIALAYAKAGAHVVAPSDMMDGRIGIIKKLLFQHGFGNSVCVMSYSAKFASCFYGPFRDAAHSAPSFGDRKNYQLPSSSSKLAIRAVKRDIKQGADIVMVKPAGPYLDIIKQIKDIVNVPIACYQVSGEYTMLWYGAKNGSFDLKTAVLESLNSMKRAGADIIITYYVPMILDWLK